MKAGFHSPLPPARSGVADYAAALLLAMQARGEMEVNAAHADVHLYHIGNNPLHWPIYQRALATPGVTVLHDTVLHHMLLGCLGREAYIEEFVFNNGEWHRQLAEDLWANRGQSGAEGRFFAFPMIKRIVSSSRRVVVHNPGAAAVVRRQAPAPKVIMIPHLYVDTARPPAYEVERERARLGVRPSTCLFAIFGHLRESKRVMEVLRVFGRLRARIPDVALLVAGEFVSSDLAHAAAPLIAQPGVIRTGYAPEDEFLLRAHACDAAINLRYPAAGETSGITIRLMGAGNAVIVTNSLENAPFPEDCVVRVDAGPAEAEMLEAMMAWLAESAGARREIGRRAAEYVRREHAVEKAAELYWQALLS